MAIGDEAAFYLRESDKGAAARDKYGIPVQRQMCQQYADANGYVVVDEYLDPGEDSAELFRPALTKLRRDMEAGRFQVLIIARSDRLARDEGLQGFLYYEAEKIFGVRIKFADPQEVYEDTPEGHLMRSIRAYANRLERQLIKQKTQAARRMRAESGKLLGNHTPAYGFQWGDAKKTCWRENPDTVHTLRRLYREVLGGSSLLGLATALTAEEVLLPSGKPGLWRPSNIRRILRNPAYIGRYDAYHQSGRKAKRHLPDGSVRTVYIKAERAEDDPARIPMPPGVVPPLVDEATWYAVQELLDRNRESAPRHNSDPDATLLRAGLLFCGHCGRAMHANNSLWRKRDGTMGGRTWTYTCSYYRDGCPGGGTSIVAADLDARVWDMLTRDILQDRDALLAMFEAWQVERQEDSDSAERQVQRLAGQMRKLNEDIENLGMRIAEERDDEIAGVLRGTLRHKLDERKGLEEVQRAAQESYRRQSDMAEHLAEFERYVDWVRDTLLQWPADEPMPVRWKRGIMHGFDARVVAWRKDTYPRFALLIGFQNALIEAMAAPGTTLQFRMRTPAPSATEREQGALERAFSPEEFNALMQPVVERALREMVKLHTGKRRDAELEAEALLQRGPDTSAGDGPAQGADATNWKSPYSRW